MTERETRVDAIRFATQQAKKHALEQVASYLESVTVVRDLDVTQDDIRSYTAGMVLVLDQQVETALDGDVVVIRVTLNAQVDSEEAGQAIIALKQNEDVRQELVALKEDADHLHQLLEDANQALARASSPEQTRQLNQRRTDLLNQAESDALVAQAWTDWVLIAPFAQPHRTGVRPRRDLEVRQRIQQTEVMRPSALLPDTGARAGMHLKAKAGLALRQRL